MQCHATVPFLRDRLRQEAPDAASTARQAQAGEASASTSLGIEHGEGRRHSWLMMQQFRVVVALAVLEDARGSVPPGAYMMHSSSLTGPQEDEPTMTRPALLDLIYQSVRPIT